MGRAATAAMISFHQTFCRASHQASGVASTSNSRVVRLASFRVVQITSDMD